MRVTVEVVGEETRAVDVDDDATYADLARAVGYSPHEVSAMVDDSPVPADQPVEADHVRLLRLIKGGSSGAPPGTPP
jgi:sulfur carrier protein